MAKNNIRSWRYSDEVAEILEKAEGENLNAKFENLVLHCYKLKPEVDKQVAAKRKELKQLTDDCNRCRTQLYEYQALDRQKKALSQALTNVAIMAVDYQEKLKKAQEDSKDDKG